MEKEKAIFLRVSKKELNEKTQLPVIIKSFKLKKDEYILLSEKISGYKEEVQDKRKALKELIKLIEEEKIKEVYVYSLERIYRNVDLQIYFYFLCRIHNVTIYSYLQPELNAIKGNRPIDKYMRYNTVLLNAFTSEHESYLISQRTKKCFHIDEETGKTMSYNNKQVGRKGTLNKEEKKYLKSYIGIFGHEKPKDIIKHIQERYNKTISRTTIYRIKKNLK